jgi:hypothetical protein
MGVLYFFRDVQCREILDEMVMGMENGRGRKWEAAGPIYELLGGSCRSRVQVSMSFPDSPLADVIERNSKEDPKGLGLGL